MKMIALLALVFAQTVSAGELTVGGMYGATGKADGTIVINAQYGFKAVGQSWYVGGMGFLSEPKADIRTEEVCEYHHHHKKPKKKCHTRKVKEDNDVSLGLYAGWQAFKIGGLSGGIGVIAFDEPDTITDGSSTVHGMLNYRVQDSPVALTLQYAGSLFYGVNFRIPLGKKRPREWTVERVK